MPHPQLALAQGSFTLLGRQMTYHDAWNKLAIDERTLPLTPTEYRLFRLFIEQGVPCEEHHLLRYNGAVLLSCASQSQIQQSSHIANRKLLRRSISNLNAKLAPYGFHLTAFDGGYCLKVTEEGGEILFS
jgi:hypothetical protein